MTRNFKLTLCYDGTRYDGWQRQGNTKNTIQEILEDALSGIFGAPTEAAGSGRTDEGVHALGQVVSFRADSEMSADDILCKLREALPQDIGALELEEAPPRFHARLSARSKTYVYHVWNSNAPCVFQRRYTYIFRRPLDADAMRQAAELLCGTHDFASFCSAKHMKHSTERTITDINIARQDDEYVFTYTGDGFLYNMVRIITGTLLSIGAGERKAEDINAVLAARDRSAAGPTAPAKGLFLARVDY